MQTAPVAHGRRQLEEQQVAARHEGVGQACSGHLDFGLAGQGRVADVAEHAQIQHVVVPELAAPLRELAPHGFEHRVARLKLHMVALAVVKTDGLHMRKLAQRPG